MKKSKNSIEKSIAADLLQKLESKIETTTGSDKGKEDDVGGNVMGLGIGFDF